MALKIQVLQGEGGYSLSLPAYTAVSHLLPLLRKSEPRGDILRKRDAESSSQDRTQLDSTSKSKKK